MNGYTTLAIRPLTAELQEIAKRELNEVPSSIPEYISTLRAWIQKQPHLCARTDDQFLIAFLRGTKYSLEKAKQKIDKFYTLKLGIPEVFNERRSLNDPKVMEIVRMGIILHIPMPVTETGPCITIIRTGAYDTDKYKFDDIIRVGTMFGDILMMENDNSTVSGYLEMMDMSGITGTHFFQLQPDLLKKLSIYADEAMPMRQCGTHFINVPQLFESGFNTLKGLFPAKAMSRISVSAQHDVIYKYVPRSYLPVEYGGENGCIQDIVTQMEAKLLQYRDYFQDEHNYGTNEKLRKEQRFNYEKCFGMEGSFRKLDID